MAPETQQSGFTPPHLAGSSRKHTNTVAPDTGGAGFTGLGIAPQLLDALDKLKFTTPTPVQKQSIPIGIEGKDLIAIAQTGTGKTLAFGIPIIQRLEQIRGRGLILLPTRELAIQVDESLQAIGRSVGLRTAVLIGGASMHVQRQHLQRKPHVIIATPGRLLDHVEQRTVNLADIRVLILDEADRMLDMGFAPQIKRIFAVLPAERQTMLFSATMPQEIVAIAQKHMKLPLRIEIARAGTAADKVTQEVFFIAKEAKARLLEALLAQYPGSVLVFTRTKHAARKLASYVKTMGHSAADIHSDRSLAQRRQALEGFKTGRYRVLVATDIAARGIDVSGIELVVNFDLPMNTQDYVHRIGRTGRAGRSGRAISFATFDQRRDVRDIERFIRTQLPIKPTPELPPARAHEPEMPPDRQQRQPHAWPARRPMAGGRGGGFRGGQRRGRGR